MPTPKSSPPPTPPRRSHSPTPTTYPAPDRSPNRSRPKHKKQSHHNSPSPSPPQESSIHRKPSKSKKLLNGFRSVFRSFPIMNPTCRMPSIHVTRLHEGGSNHVVHGGTRVTGTLFGCKRSRVNLVIQENPRCLPMLVLELSIMTGKLLQDMGSGLVRIALECEKHPSDKTKMMDEPIWTMYCNGRKTGYGVKREATDDDLNVIVQTLQAVSMGAGVLPSGQESTDGEMTYMRAYFERVVGSRDSETYYMMNPDGNTGPELSIFFVRV
ncbi:protein MIZU-KUSSEI 1 [Impatiens glandulifera]|uniref:protein MIZU-KUSSEI 1 n=1 Tax=Impatiens glandulifera TaxID=253017 RepID=UPI001FB06387|nr:protein MIZU-KUSSEI 1 [Impatiens glandulifera]